MNKIPNRSSHVPLALVTLLSLVWIALAVWARWNSGSLASVGSGPPTTIEALFIFLALSASVVLLSIALQFDDKPPNRGGRLVAIAMFAFVSSALVVDGNLSAWDAVAAPALLGGVGYSMRPSRRRVGASLIGIGCACSPLSLGAVSVFLAGRDAPRHRVASLLIAAGTAVVLAVGVGLFAERPWTDAAAVRSDVARVGPAYVWTLTAWWLDLVMPALVLAMMAVSMRVFGPPDDAHGESTQASVEHLASIWLGTNAVIAVFLPRVLVSHGLLLALPAFLLVPDGWRTLRLLPFTRTNLTLSLLTAAYYGFMLMLVWVPVRAVLQLSAKALYGL